MIAVIIVAQNDAAHLGACLRAVREASRRRRLGGEVVLRLVVLDSCTDGSAGIARDGGAHLLRLQAGNLGVARARGAQRAIERGARWLAFTTADAVVAPEWLSAQLALGADVVCGKVAARDEALAGESARVHTDAACGSGAEGHPPVHGASLGISVDAYCRAGGFRPLASGDDAALVRALQACGATVAWSATPLVLAHAQRLWRAPSGAEATVPRIGVASRVTEVTEAQVSA